MSRSKILLIAGLLFSLQAAAKEDIGLLELVNYVEYSPQLASSGQPTKAQLGGLVEAKIDLVVNLAPVTSPGAYAEEGKLIQQLGIDYVHIPVNWDAPPMADVEKFMSVMTQAKAKDQRVLVHCYVNARASAFTYLWRVLKLGDNREAARKDMLAIWNLNKGFELHNTPAWNQLINAAEEKEW